MPQTFSRSRQRVLKQAMAWFVQLQSEHCDENQRQQFQSWLAKNEAHHHAFQEAERVWSNLDSLKHTRVSGLEAARNARPRPRSAIHQAFIGMLLAASMAGWWQDYTTETLTYATGIGQRRSLDLADGSHIDLNAASRLSVRLSWIRRRIELEDGEALFTVAHESLRTFTVQAGSLQIRDIGTVFDVRRRPEGTAVSVIEGEVALNDGQSWFSESLKAGFSRQLDSSGRLQSIEKANVKQATGWLEGNLLFEHTPLKKVVAELERYHAVHFVFADPSLARQTLNGSFDAADLNLFLRVVEKILPIRINREKETIVLTRG